MPRSDDPIREEVERVLRTLLTAPLVLPLATAGVIRRCIGRRLGDVRRRVAEPAALVRSLFDIAGSGALIDPGTGPSTAPSPTATTPSTDAAVAPRARRRAPSLPIEEYQSLAASQVVARLPALTAEELRAVRRYEAAHRSRRTVLGRIDQLLLPS